MCNHCVPDSLSLSLRPSGAEITVLYRTRGNKTLQTKVGSADLYIKSLSYSEVNQAETSLATCHHSSLWKYFDDNLAERKKTCAPNVLMDGHVSCEAYKKNWTPNSSKNWKRIQPAILHVSVQSDVQVEISIGRVCVPNPPSIGNKVFAIANL